LLEAIADSLRASTAACHHSSAADRAVAILFVGIFVMSRKIRKFAPT